MWFGGSVDCLCCWFRALSWLVCVWGGCLLVICCPVVVFSLVVLFGFIASVPVVWFWFCFIIIWVIVLLISCVLPYCGLWIWFIVA